MMIALVALKKWHIQGLDVKTTFLYGELDKELYMEQPKGFKVKGQEGKVMRLKHTIYGLKQAALAWWKALDKSSLLAFLPPCPLRLLPSILALRSQRPSPPLLLPHPSG
jgi:Reverse transcriptase (RNA-dependent DNA polymerase)